MSADSKQAGHAGRCLLEFFDKEGHRVRWFDLADTTAAQVFDIAPGITKVKVTLSSASSPTPAVAMTTSEP